MQTWVLILLAWPHLPTLCKGPDIPHLASKVFGSLQTTWLIKRDDECVTSFEPESLAAATSGTRTWCWLFLRLIAGALGTLRVMSSCQTLGHGCSLTRVHYHLNAESLLRYRSSQIEASCVRAALSLHFQLWPVFCSTGGYGGRCTQTTRHWQVLREGSEGVSFTWKDLPEVGVGTICWPQRCEPKQPSLL